MLEDKREETRGSIKNWKYAALQTLHKCEPSTETVLSVSQCGCNKKITADPFYDVYEFNDNLTGNLISDNNFSEG